METLRKLLLGLAITAIVVSAGLMATFGPGVVREIRKAAGRPLANPMDRVGGTSAQLPDGRILIAGAQFRGTKSAEFCDPVTGAFTPTAALIRPRRWQLASCILSDGRMLVAGGQGLDERPAREVEAFDPVRGTWLSLGQLPEECRVSDLVPLADGTALFVTQERGESGLQRFDPATGTFSPVGHPSQAVNGTPKGTRLKDGRVLITHLEYGERGAGTSNAYLFDPATGRTSLLPRMSRRRSQHEATLMEDGRVLITGGSDGEPSAELFDPATLTFTPAGPMVAPRCLHAAAALPDGRVLILQGISDVRTGPLPDADKLLAMKPGELVKAMPKPAPLKCEAELYDPRTNRFTPATEPPSRIGTGMGLDRSRGFRRGNVVLFLSMNGLIQFKPETGTWHFPQTPADPSGTREQP